MNSNGSRLPLSRTLQSVFIPLLLLLWAVPLQAEPDKGHRPNIIVILADDMGYSDAGCYGGEIDTPNIDRLAADGLRFNDFYNVARCCPTRASLLTGQYPHKVGVAKNGVTMNRQGVTIAEALGEAGYNTAMFGKWHLSIMQPLDSREKQLQWLNHQFTPDRPFAPLDSYPVNRGFDEHYGVIWGVVNFFDPYSLVQDTEPVETVPEGYYFTRALNEKTADAIKRLSAKEKPFFIYLAHTAPHWPLHALPEDIAKYKNRYRDGWDQLRRERFERQQQIKLFSCEMVLPPVQDKGMEWENLTPDEKHFMASKMAVHAAMVDRLDQGVGLILDALEETGQLDNTVILFLSDNGASPETPKSWGPGLDRPSETRSGEKILYEGFDHPGPETTFAGIGPAWASAANSPFRYWKAEQYNGGNRTPFIVHWPAGLKVKCGSITDQRAHVIDILPTCLELAGAPYPESYNGHELNPLDGKSLLPVFRGKRREGHDALYFEHMGGKAILKDQWKLVSLRNDVEGYWSLYNVAQDPTETQDLAAGEPETVTRLSAEWQDWARSVGLEFKQPKE